MYDTTFCRSTASEWTTSGSFDWNKKDCDLKADRSKYNSAWMGQRDAQSLLWNDYRCQVAMTFDLGNSDSETRSIIAYAQSVDSGFDHMNGYECAVTKCVFFSIFFSSFHSCTSSDHAQPLCAGNANTWATLVLR